MQSVHVVVLALVCVIFMLSNISHFTHSAPLPPSEHTHTWFSACLSSSSSASSSASSSSSSSSSSSLVLKSGLQRWCVAWGYFEDGELNTTGWSHLFVETNPSFTDVDQSMAAGFLEGALTSERIQQFYVNTRWFMIGEPARINMSWFDEWVLLNNNFIEQHLNKLDERDTYTDSIDMKFWHQVRLTEAQLKGVALGMTVSSYPNSQNITTYHLRFMNLLGDLSDIQNFLHPVNSSSASFSSSSSSSWQRRSRYRTDHCSALVRLVDGFTDLFVSHATWFGFNSALRIYKQYVFHFKDAVNVQIMFAGYPAVLYSLDDFYVLRESAMTVMETTNEVYNLTYYSSLPFYAYGVPVWQRAMVSNRLAASGQEWATYFRLYNSGTYNNQWMIVDHKRFELGSRPENGTLTICSQMPDTVHVLDATPILIRDKYWASYNVPYFWDFYVNSGYQALAQSVGEFYYGHHGYFRQLLFQREAPQIKTVDDMKRVMRLNKWQTDEFSNHSSQYAIAARFDLTKHSGPDGSDPQPYGAMDAKIIAHSQSGFDSKYKKASPSLTVHIVNGPTTDDQPAFSFADWPGVPHQGLPTVLDFPWITVSWAQSSSSNGGSSDAPFLHSQQFFGLWLGALLDVVVIAVIAVFLWQCHKRRSNTASLNTDYRQLTQ